MDLCLWCPNPRPSTQNISHWPAGSFLSAPPPWPLFSSSALIFLSLKSKILCFLWSHFSTQSSTMSMVLYSLVSQTHPVFLGYNLAVWEFGWSLEQVAYGGEANLSLLRSDWTPIWQGWFCIEAVWRWARASTWKRACLQPCKLREGVDFGPLSKCCFYITYKNCLMLYSCWSKYLVRCVVVYLPGSCDVGELDLHLPFQRE